MLRKLFLILSFCFLIQEGISHPRTRIVNGTYAVLGEFPYHASLQKEGNTFCGAFILDATHILTAAHCVKGLENDSWNVIVGSVNLQEFVEPAANHSVISMNVHNDYVSGNGFKNDIALLKLATPIVFNDYVKAAILPEPHEEFEAEAVAIATGFGQPKLNTPVSPFLMKAYVNIVDQKECESYFPSGDIRPTNICARNATSITGTCRGDSGGPLTVNGKVVGLVSFALEYGCVYEHPEYPQVYTRISEYIDWIKNMTAY